MGRGDSASGASCETDLHSLLTRGHAAARARLACILLSTSGMMSSAAILVVEDNDAMRDAVIELLSDEGLATVAARDCDSALDALRHHPFGAVVSDLHMPASGGFELLDEVRSHYPGSRFILMTSDGGQRARAEAHGAFELLVKPFASCELLDVVTRALESRHAPG
jgi:DNA-binding NtrC family response regulator